MKKFLLYITIFMIGIICLPSCSVFDPTPENYITGVAFEPDSFPEEDIQIYQNSVLFRTGMVTKYGVLGRLGSDDDVDTITTYYLDMLNANGLDVSGVEDIDNGKIITGKGKDYGFTIKTIDAKNYDLDDKYVKREYKSVTVITIDNSIVKQLEGLWYACGYKDNLLLMDNGVMSRGIAYDFHDGYVTGYALGIVVFKDVEVEWVDEDTIAFDVAGDGNKITTSVEDAHMPWKGIDETIMFTDLSDDIVYMKTTMEDMTFRMLRAQSLISSLK